MAKKETEGDRRDKIAAMKQAHLDLLKNNLSARRITDAPTADKPVPPPVPDLSESASDRWRKSVGLPTANGHATDTAKPDERYKPSSADASIPGTGTTSGRQDSFLDDMRRQLYEIGFEGGGFQNRPSARDVAKQQAQQANRDRIIKLFHETPYAGELLANGKIWWDNRHLWPEDWEREFFRGTS
jgi:hypothetical protein